MRYELKSVGLWAFFRVAFFLNLIIGFLSGLLFIPFMFLAMLAESAGPYGELDGMSGGVSGWVLMIMPFIMAIGFGVLYTVMGLIMAAIYNLLARVVGGFEFVLEPVGTVSPIAPSMAPPPRPLVAPTPPPPPPSASMTPAPGPAPSSETPGVRPTSPEAGVAQQPLFEPQPPRPVDREPSAEPRDRGEEAPPQL